MTCEALDVNTTELPPGRRGYGASDYIDHPDTPARQQKVEALTAELASSGRCARERAEADLTRIEAREPGLT